MTKETTMMLLAALLDQIEKGEIFVEGVESLANDQAGHITIHWLTKETKEKEKEYQPLL